MPQNSSALIARYYITAFFIFALGSCAGAFYCLWRFGGGADVKGYIDSALSYVSSGADTRAIVMKSMRGDIVTFAIFLVSAALRLPGVALIGAEVARRGFICGFTAFSLMAARGARGVLLALASVPSGVLFVPITMLFAAINALTALGRFSVSKKFIYFYIIFSMAVLTIFCVSALAEGYVTTIFMKWLS